MTEAVDRANGLAAAIEAVLEAYGGAEELPLALPAEAKPVGPYETFGICVGAMRRRGHSEDEARRICGSMEPKAGTTVGYDACVARMRRQGYDASTARQVCSAGDAAGRKARRPTAADQAYLRRVVRATKPIQRKFEGELRVAFATLGRRAARAWHELKEPGDPLTVEMMLRAAGVAGFADDQLAPIYRRLYLLTGEAVYGAVSERVGLSIGWSLEDALARAVVEAGGKRVGIIDVIGDTRAALFDALHDGRVAGEGADAMAGRIAEYVPAGRFSAMEADRPGAGVAYRSEMIARTETTYARNVSAVAAGQQAGFDQFVVFDARLGPTDDECEALDGEIVGADEVDFLIDDEHPNGTRSVSPIPSS